MKVEGALQGESTGSSLPSQGTGRLASLFCRAFWLAAVASLGLRPWAVPHAHHFSNCLMVNLAFILLANQRHLYMVKKLKKEKTLHTNFWRFWCNLIS